MSCPPSSSLVDARRIRKYPGHQHPVLFILPQLDPVTASHFGRVERLVRELQCAAGISLPGCLHDGNAHTDRHPGCGTGVTMFDGQLRDRTAHSFCNILRLAWLEVVKNRSELLAAVARQDIQGAANESLYGLGDLAQGLVASLSRPTDVTCSETTPTAQGHFNRCFQPRQRSVRRRIRAARRRGT